MTPAKGKQVKGKQPEIPAETPAKQIWYLLVDHERKLNFGGLTFLDVQPDITVAALMKRIKEEHSDLGPFHANKLEPWTYKHNDLLKCKRDKLKEIVSRIKFSEAGRNPNPNLLLPAQKVKTIGLPEGGILLVRVPPLRKADTAGGSDKIGDGAISSDLFQHYEAFFINMTSWDGFKQSDLQSNELTLQNKPPNFVVQFRQKLDSKRTLSPDAREGFQPSFSLPPGQDVDVNDVLKCIIPDSPSRTAYFDLDGATTDPRLHAGLSEVRHIGELACEPWEKLWDAPYGHDFKEDAANSIFFHRFVLNVPEDGEIVAKLKHSWPLRLILNCPAEPENERFRHYTPRSDFLIATSALPRLLVEVNSTKTDVWPPDLIRMLLSGAFVVRFSNEFLKPFRKKKQFVLVAIFIQKNGEATRYLLYQLKNDKAVHYTMDAFNLKRPVGRVKFERQLYNLLSILGEEEEVTMTPLKQFDDRIEDHKGKHGMKSLFTKKSKGKDGPDGAGAGAGAGIGGAGAGAGVGGTSATDSEDLRAHGYEVKMDVIVDNNGGTFEPFFKAPPNILTVFRRSDPSKKFIAKKVREDSKELEILKFLNNFQPRSEHIISLLDSFQVQSRTWAILPKMGTLAVYILTDPHRHSEHFSQICWGLIKGLAYLHQHCIAHRDIKPGNLLVRKEDHCLKVIDFDLAIQVKDEDEEVDGEYGTEGWMAPEVEVQSSTYSPIRADRWSCGKVIIFLLKEVGKKDELLSGIAEKLMDLRPKVRPSLASLVESQTSSALPVLDGAKGRRAGERKASRPREEIIKDDEEGLNAKKRRLAISRKDGSLACRPTAGVL